MRNKIILLTLLPTLIFSSTTFIKAAGYDVKGQTRLIPILRWMVRNPDYLWAEQYLPFVAQANMWGIMTNFQVLQPIQNGQKIKINNLATDGCLVGKEGFDYYLRAYEIPYFNPKTKELKGGGYAIIKKLTIEDCQRGYVEFEMPPLIISPEKPPVSSAIFYFVITKEQAVSETESQEALAISPPLKYTYVPPPPPKITILPVPRVTAILEIKPSPTPPPEAGCPNCVEIRYKFKVENVSQANPFYLNSVTLQLNRAKRWPFQSLRVIVYGGGPANGGGKAYYADAELNTPKSNILTISNFRRLSPVGEETLIPLVNDEYEIKVVGEPYSLDDPNYPWEDGFVSFSLISVTAKNPQGQIVRSTGQDTSETYKIYVPSPPKISIVPLARPEPEKIRDLRPETTIEIPYQFEVKDVSSYQTLYLDSIVFRTNNWSWLPFKEIKVTVQAPDGNTVEATATNTRTYMAIFSFKDQQLPLVNGTYKVTFTGTTYSPQDQDYPYLGGRVAFRFHSVTASDQASKVKVESSGSDLSHTYQIIVPYYPSVNVNALVGSEEYPALVYEKEGDTATLYFTSFTRRFNAIRAGIQLPATSTLPGRGVTTMGITKTIEVSQDCGGTCPRTYEGLVEKFGSPDQWAIPLIRWDWSKTAQYTLNLSMNCFGNIPTIKNDDPNRNKSFVFVCSNIQAFGNNFGWNRRLNVRLIWSLTGNEKLNYEVFYPDVVKVSLSGTLQRALTATVFRGRR